MILYTLRFLSLLAHAITTTFLYQLVPVIVQTGLNEDANHHAYSKRKSMLIAFISLSLACLLCDALFFISGTTLRRPLVTMFNLICHSMGAFFTLWIILDGWPWQSVPYVFAFFTFPPFAVELIIFSPIKPIIVFFQGCCGGILHGCVIIVRVTLYILHKIYEYLKQAILQRTCKPEL